MTSTAPERAPQYQQVFHFVHPYLCDPEHLAARRYGVQPQVGKAMGGLLSSAPDLVKSMVGAPHHYHLPKHEEGKALLAGEMDALFLIDKDGTIRFSRAACGNALLPSNAEIIRMLDQAAGAA